MKESLVQAKIIKYLQNRHAYVVKVITASKAGVADLLVCYKGLFIAIEVKAPGKLGTQSELQKANATMVRASGGVSLLVDNLQDVIAFFDSLDSQH